MIASVKKHPSVLQEATDVSGHACMNVQWNLYKATTIFCGLSRQVVFHDCENKHDFVKTMPGKLQNLCVLVRFPRPYYTGSTVF